jgi:chaperonin GroES
MLRPIDARVIVEKKVKQEKTESGIFLPDSVDEQAQVVEGDVIAVGPGSRNMMNGESMPMDIKVGDTILYTKFAATEVQYKGKEYMVVIEKDIIAVVDDK